MPTHSVAGTCRNCGKPLVLKVDDDYPWPIEELLPLAACNRCYDAHDKFKKAEANIKNICLWLIQTEKPAPEKLSATQKKLENWTRSYAEAMQQLNNADRVVWSEEFAQNLMEQPDKWHDTLEFYRDRVQQYAQLSGISPPLA